MIKKMENNILLLVKPNDNAAIQAGKIINEWALNQKIKIIDVSQQAEIIKESVLKNIKLGVTIGGDGSLLTLFRRLEKKDLFPLLAVNIGRLGFITQVSRQKMVEVVSSVFQGKCSEDNRFLLEIELWRENHCVDTGVVFNEAAITRDVRSSIFEMEIFVSQSLLSQIRADGLVVATSTGSTGYALSAGGPIIHPDVMSILLNPVCSHSLSSRSVIVSLDQNVEIVLKHVRGTVYLVYDGQINVELKEGDKIRVKKSVTQVRLIKGIEEDWISVVRSKLHLT